MKILKKVLFVLLGIIVLALLIALIVPKDYGSERQITIEASKIEVFDFVKYLKNQDKYSVWAKIDPDMRTEFRGTDATVGFVSAWDSDNKDAGKGEQEIIGIEPYERIDYELRFKEPFESTSYAYMITEAVNDSTTTVKWGVEGSFPYPMNLFLLSLNMDKMLGADLHDGLVNLKKMLESKPEKEEILEEETHSTGIEEEEEEA